MASSLPTLPWRRYQLKQIIGLGLLIFWMTFGVSAGTAASGSAGISAAGSLSTTKLPARTLTAVEFVDALKGWDKDYAIMLHASWCRYCKQFKLIWGERAANIKLIRFQNEPANRNYQENKVPQRKFCELQCSCRCRVALCSTV